MTIAQRLAQAMEKSGMTSQPMLSRASGVPQPTISRILNGGSTSPTRDVVRALAEACGVHIEWLLDGTEKSSPISARTLSFFQLPISNLFLKSGSPDMQVATAVNDEVLNIDVRWLRMERLQDSHLVAFRQHGDEMAPLIFHGDILVIDQSNRRLVDDGVYAFNRAGSLVVRRARDAGGNVWCTVAERPSGKSSPIGIQRIDEKTDFVLGRIVRRESSKF